MTPAALALLVALVAPPPPPARTGRPPVRIQADDVDSQLRQGRTVMTGKPVVTLTREDAVLTCLRLVVESDARGRFQRASCEGDVKLVKGTRTVTCATAVYEDENARLICRGNPTLRDGPSEMAGEELTYDLDEDRVRLTRGKGVLYEPGAAPAGEGKR